MSRLRTYILNALQFVGDKSGCHQIPERCLKFGNYTMPICARCTGVLLGEILSVFFLIFGMRLDFFGAIILISIMGIDWLIQELGICESANSRRLITGILGGFGIVCLYYKILILILNVF